MGKMTSFEKKKGGKDLDITPCSIRFPPRQLKKDIEKHRAMSLSPSPAKDSQSLSLIASPKSVEKKNPFPRNNFFPKEVDSCHVDRNALKHDLSVQKKALMKSSSVDGKSIEDSRKFPNASGATWLIRNTEEGI